jgi:hypothetical protein
MVPTSISRSALRSVAASTRTMTCCSGVGSKKSRAIANGLYHRLTGTIAHSRSGMQQRCAGASLRARGGQVTDHSGVLYSKASAGC